jgi:glycosyltransferase involved in cell wall biosynthesis
MNVHFTLHDNFDPNAGGMGVSAGLASAYRRCGHEVDYLTFGDLPRMLSFRVKYLVFPEFVALRLRNSPADVIDASCGDAWLWARLRRRAQRESGPLLVTRSHGLLHMADIARRAEARRGGIDLSWKYPLYWGGYRLREVAKSFRLADLCLFLNDEERRFGVEELGLAEERTRVIDNGLPDFLLGRSPEPAEAISGSFGIAHVGSYLPLKGVRYAVAALGAVLDRHPQAHVTFLGTGCPAEKVLGDFDAGQRNRVKVLQNYDREELPTLLRGHAAVISATLKEGFPLGTLEAMACGLTAVTAATPGPLQYVRDEVNGLVVPRADGAALEAALERLIDDPELLRSLRLAANETAQRYSWDRVAGDTLELYAEALENRRRAAGFAHSP